MKYDNKNIVEEFCPKKKTQQEKKKEKKKEDLDDLGHSRISAMPFSSSAFPSYISGVHHFGQDFCVCDRFLIQPFR